MGKIGEKCQGPGLLPTLWAILITHFRDKSFTIFLGHLLFASFYRTHLQLQFDRPDERAYLRQNCLKVDQEKGDSQSAISLLLVSIIEPFSYLSHTIS